jgi:hypothetical protein
MKMQTNSTTEKTYKQRKTAQEATNCLRLGKVSDKRKKPVKQCFKRELWN